MGKKKMKFKHRVQEHFGSMKGFHERLEENGKKITLHKLYLISGGFVEAKPTEKALLARFLQTPAVELFGD